MKAAAATLDGIIDTGSTVHPVEPLMGLLKAHGKMVFVGLPDKPVELPVFPMVAGRRRRPGA
ncbi:8-hydroxygeraniol dehydrogenase [Phtheirospermum japonicum]|uniref:8-hydroxygeraniol dehydrogenase n=1 Tax=Phtheirospermum japonicum TaxID=374723 RepID=A0A830B8N5_9LAMI|nr:8-hydroxygeraniol dehydrogenase [Phtheirospermum japonicum]